MKKITLLDNIRTFLCQQFTSAKKLFFIRKFQIQKIKKKKYSKTSLSVLRGVCVCLMGQLQTHFNLFGKSFIILFIMD